MVELLFRHPSVGEVAMVDLPDGKWGEQVGHANSPTCVHKHAVIVIGARRCAAQSHR
jgi:hypothetical protein